MIDQTNENKYNVELRVDTEEDQQNKIISNIELNPEDIVIMKKYLEVYIYNISIH